MQNKEIETLSSRLVYENRWMRLREDAIRRRDGSTGIYGVVEKPDFAIIAAVQDQSMYLVEQYRYPAEGRFWELPQGSWEKDEIEPIDLAKAELKEETGLISSEMRQVGELFEAYGYSSQKVHVFLATALTRGETELDLEEQGLVSARFPIAEVERMIVDGEIKDSATVAAIGLLKLKGLL
jgi:8-oxo-dGTP pyrophosphatase MutT (NUDIX family)